MELLVALRSLPRVAPRLRRQLQLQLQHPTRRSISLPQPRIPHLSVPLTRPRFERTDSVSAPAPAPTSQRDRTRSPPRRPTNRQIPFDHVFVLDPATNKPSRTKQRLEDLVAVETRAKRIVELVASTPEPIVRVTTRSEVEARYKEMKRALKKGSKAGEEPKEVQFTWGVAQADLEHKLRKARRDLEKGNRVVVVVNMKNGHRPSSRNQMMAFADEISEALRGVGEEWKGREFTQRMMALSFQKVELKDDAS